MSCCPVCLASTCDCGRKGPPLYAPTYSACTLERNAGGRTPGVRGYSPYWHGRVVRTIEGIGEYIWESPRRYLSREEAQKAAQLVADRLRGPRPTDVPAPADQLLVLRRATHNALTMALDLAGEGSRTALKFVDALQHIKDELVRLEKAIKP